MSHKIMKFKINKKNKSNIFLKGKKIYFKPFEEEDISETYKRDLNDISNLGINIIFPKNKVELRSYCKMHKYSHSSILFSICEVKNNQTIGTTSLSQINWINRNAVYGRLIFKEFRNNGYGTECLILLKRYAFNYLNLKSLYTIIFSNNKGSIKSNIRSGGKICGKLKKHSFKNRKYHDASLIQHLK